MLADVLGGDRDFFVPLVRGVEADRLHHALDDRVKPAGADVLRSPIQVVRHLGHLVDGILGKLDRDAFGPEQLDLLAREGMLRLVENADEIILGEVRQLHADGETALKLRHQIAGLAAVKRSGGDEENVVRPDRAILGDDGGAFDNRQKIALHALAGNVRAVLRLRAANLVDLVEEYDSALLDALDGLAINLVAIDEFLRFLGEQGTLRASATGRRRVSRRAGSIFSSMD